MVLTLLQNLIIAMVLFNAHLRKTFQSRGDVSHCSVTCLQLEIATALQLSVTLTWAR